MPAGFRLYRENSPNIQIDQDYSNFALRSKGAVYIDQPIIGFDPARVGTITVPGTTGVIAYRSGVQVLMLQARFINGNTEYVFYAQSPTWIDYWQFDKAEFGLYYSNMNAGLIVFKDNGAVAFDSRLKYLRFLDIIIEGPSPSDRGYAGTWPAVIQGGFSYTASTDPLPQDPTEQTYIKFWDGMGTLTDGQAVRFRSVNMVSPILDLPPGSGNYNSSDQNIFTIVDVAGY